MGSQALTGSASEEMKWVVERQRKELGNTKSNYKRHPKLRKLLYGVNSALLIEEVEISFETKEGEESKFVIQFQTN